MAGQSGTRGLSTTVAADGTAVIRIRPGGLYPWNVTQVTAENKDAPAGATCSLRRNGFLVTPLVPNGDAGAGDPPVPIDPQDDLTVEWAGCTPGQLVRALIFFDQIRPGQ